MSHTPTESDELLMRRYLSGDSAAFEELYRRHAPRVLAYFARKLPRRSDAEELHQAVFLKFHRIRHRYDPRYPVLQWLFVIARTTLVDFFRREGRRVPEADGVSVETVAETVATENSGAVSHSTDASALDALSEDQRRLVEMKYLDDLTYEEMAQKLGKTSASLRQAVSRAIRKLRRLDAEKGNEA